MMVGSIYPENKLFYAPVEFEKFYIQISWEVDGEKHLWEIIPRNNILLVQIICPFNIRTISNWNLQQWLKKR